MVVLLLLSSSCSPLSDTDLPRFMDLVMTDMMGGPCECVCLCHWEAFLVSSSCLIECLLALEDVAVVLLCRMEAS
jgi:hypothetical protein